MKKELTLKEFEPWNKGIFVPIEDRFWKFVKKTKTCWIWIGSKNSSGYGDIRYGNKHKHLKAHRVSYELHKSKIPKGIHVLHSCDNPSCVNPEHLSLGTHKDNMRDMVGRRRLAFGERSPHAKLKTSQIKEIRKCFKNNYYYGIQRFLAKEYRVTPGHISEIINNKKRKYE